MNTLFVLGMAILSIVVAMFVHLVCKEVRRG